MNDLLLLSLDTATRRRSVAVSRGLGLITVQAGDAGASGAADILTEIDEALTKASCQIQDVDAFAVTLGPGAFTGLRAGLATVKAFAATLHKPLVGVQTLHAIAHAARPGHSIQTIISAGRAEVYVQCLSVTQAGELSEIDAPCLLAPQVLIEKFIKLGGGIKWAGNISDSFYELLKRGADNAGIKLVEATSDNLQPETDEWMIFRQLEVFAPSVAALALTKILAGEAVNAGQLQAKYVREPGAEFKIHVTRNVEH